MIKGLIAPILTPFNDDLSLNNEIYNEFAKYLLNNGCSGLAPFGTTGEALSVSNSERIKALESMVKSGINPNLLIPGTGLCNFPDTVKISRHAMELGCHGVMVLPPFYYKGISDEGLFAHYEKLISEINHSDLKIYLYHIPAMTGVPLSVELVNKLKSKYPDTVVGIKDSTGDWNNTKSFLEIDKLIVYPGAELLVIDSIKLGGPGCISATANINSKNISKVINFAHDGDWENANEIMEDVRNVRLLFQDYAPIPAQKAMLAKQFNEPAWRNVRSPLLQTLTKDQSDILAEKLTNEYNIKI
ncbi:MAG: dihydrodipicolinate synthase family protein [Chloroflexi bacterium]|nr:dihydrodipicolinate synthase family protein [Chloroflexota bacterium]|tara:strand:- start:17858 stop:18760 length:903 start_codon:yes stop_codon:yes gene_type:complete